MSRFSPPLFQTTLSQAADAQARRAGEFITRVGDPSRRDELARELSVIQAERQQEQGTLRVVVFGTGSAGKTSLINALLGRKVGETEAVIGTTQHGENHTYELGGVEGTVYLTDTPGLAEAGPGGEVREIEARSLAVRADLLLFVVDHDLLRGEYERLIELARLGKRSIVVLNKKDRFPDHDLAAIVAKLRERLSGVIDAADIVTVAAAPRPIPVHVRRPDGTTETVLEVEEPDIGTLRAGSARFWRARGSSCGWPTCWFAAAFSSVKRTTSSNGSESRERRRWSSITSGSRPARSSPTRFPRSTSWPAAPCSLT